MFHERKPLIPFGTSQLAKLPLAQPNRPIAIENPARGKLDVSIPSAPQMNHKKHRAASSHRSRSYCLGRLIEDRWLSSFL
jgi:hypothetical protein